MSIRPTRDGTSGIPTPVMLSASHQISLTVIPPRVAKEAIARHHYLGTMPAGTQLALGVMSCKRLMGALTFGVGAMNGHLMVKGAKSDDSLTLTRLWLAEEMPRNSASRVLGMATRSLRRHTDVKFLFTYADPEHGHIGVIYQANNWTYVGTSEPSPLYDLGDGVPRHSRTVGLTLGTRSLRLLEGKGIRVQSVPQHPKHRYMYFLDRRWRSRLLVPEMPYPRKTRPAKEDHP